MSAAFQTEPERIARAERLLAALPYVAGAETDTPDYWALPATGGYAAGYRQGMAMVRECLDYFGGSSTEKPVEQDGHIHLLMVMLRMAERIREVSGTDATAEGRLTLRGHLAGFCSALEAECRRMLRGMEPGLASEETYPGPMHGE